MERYSRRAVFPFHRRTPALDGSTKYGPLTVNCPCTSGFSPSGGSFTHMHASPGDQPDIGGAGTRVVGLAALANGWRTGRARVVVRSTLDRRGMDARTGRRAAGQRLPANEAGPDEWLSRVERKSGSRLARPSPRSYGPVSPASTRRSSLPRSRPTALNRTTAPTPHALPDASDTKAGRDMSFRRFQATSRPDTGGRATPARGRSRRRILSAVVVAMMTASLLGAVPGLAVAGQVNPAVDPGVINGRDVGQRARAGRCRPTSDRTSRSSTRACRPARSRRRSTRSPPQQVDNEMGTQRYALLFKPGTYGTAERAA